jgi:hypothetical protein
MTTLAAFTTFTSFTTKETYLQAIADWKQSYTKLSQGQRNRKNQIRTNQHTISDVPVFSYDWDIEQQDAWWAQYGGDYGSARKNHSKLAIANRDGAKEATEMLATLKQMKLLAGAQSDAKMSASQPVKLMTTANFSKLGKSNPCVLTA